MQALNGLSPAAGGRKWRKVRRATMMNELIIKAWKTKEGSPTSGDIVKSAAVLKGEVVPYAAAYRTLMQESQFLSKKQATKGYKLIIPYLGNLTKKQTPWLDTNVIKMIVCLYQLYIIPCFMNRVLKHVRPIISLNAAQMKQARGVGNAFHCTHTVRCKGSVPHW